jgi:hypothetical protein
MAGLAAADALGRDVPQPETNAMAIAHPRPKNPLITKCRFLSRTIARHLIHVTGF